MGKVNRFMPTNDCSLLEVFEGGEIYWCFLENEAQNSSRLIITFIRNAHLIQNEQIKHCIKERGLAHLLSEKRGRVTKKTGVFEELEFWNPHIESIPAQLKGAKDMFRLRLMKTDAKKHA